MGAGHFRLDGRLVGISIATAHHTFYLPFGHKGGDNLDERIVIRYVKDLCEKAPEILFANAPYDLGWLHTKGITCNKVVRDIQVAESLLDEERFSYSLDSISKDHLGVGKDEVLLREISAIQGSEFNPKADLWKLPARYVGTYAEADARRTFDVYEKQKPMLRDQGLWDLWEMECAITKISHRMTTEGIRVDIAEAERINHDLIKEETLLKRKFQFDIWSTNQIAQYCDKEGVSYPLTPKGNPSITKEFMRDCDDSRLAELKHLREINRLRKVFIEDGIIKGNIRGRVHSQFIQTSRDNDSGGVSGTRSGRFSSKNPNLQQVPKRSNIGKQIRGLYLAEDGCLWSKCDYSSQEPRLQVHYALGDKFAGAEDAANAFREGKKLYTFFEETIGLPYDMCKDIFLGKSYGMGISKMAGTLGMSEEKCKETLELYDKTFPFLGLLNNSVQQRAKRKGYVRTILGRKMRFDFWAPPWSKVQAIKGQKVAYARFMQAEEALAKKENRDPDLVKVERAYVYKALNRLIQGSAADQTKQAMVDLENAGIGGQLPVHDELNRTNCMNEKEAYLQKEIMEQAVPLRLPTVADLDIGKNWL